MRTTWIATRKTKRFDGWKTLFQCVRSFKPISTKTNKQKKNDERKATQKKTSKGKRQNINGLTPEFHQILRAGFLINPNPSALIQCQISHIYPSELRLSSKSDLNENLFLSNIQKEEKKKWTQQKKEIDLTVSVEL